MRTLEPEAWKVGSNAAIRQSLGSTDLIKDTLHLRHESRSYWLWLSARPSLSRLTQVPPPLIQANPGPGPAATRSLQQAPTPLSPGRISNSFKSILFPEAKSRRVPPRIAPAVPMP